jgi:hypothetical protein
MGDDVIAGSLGVSVCVMSGTFQQTQPRITRQLAAVAALGVRVRDMAKPRLGEDV